MNDYWLAVLDAHYSNCGDSGVENPASSPNSTIEFPTSVKENAVAI